MLKIILTSLILVLSFGTSAQINIPSLSPSVDISQKIGLTKATLSYSRPSLRGRELFGEEGILTLNEKWRTGANATSKIEFSSDIKISGKQLLKGAYALLSTPNEKSWTFHFYSYEKLPYTNFLEKNAVLEVTVPIQKVNYSLETLSIHFESIGLNSANFVLQWGDCKVELPIILNEHESILNNIEKVLTGPSNFNYFQGALYLHETQTDLPLALAYIRKVTQDDSALFFQVYREALILKDLGRDKEAVKTAKRSLKLSKKAGNDDLARLSQQIINKLSN